MNNIAPQELLNGFLVFFLLASAIVALVNYFFATNKVKLKGKIFVISRQDPATTAISFNTRGTYAYKSDKIAIPEGIDFASAFPTDRRAASQEDADTLITLMWGYEKVGTYQGHSIAWVHTCSVHVKTRTHLDVAGTLRDAPPPSIGVSPGSHTGDAFGSVHQVVLDFLKKLPFEQIVVCPNCHQDIYPTDAAWACPECGLPARKSISKKIIGFGALALVYLCIGFFTLYSVWICVISFGLAAFFLWRAAATTARSIKLYREFPVFQKPEKKPLIQKAAQTDTAATKARSAEKPDGQRVEEFFRHTAEAWSAGKLKPFIPGSNEHEFPVEKNHKRLTTEYKYKPFEGNALLAFFTRCSPVPGEFLVNVHDYFICTNIRLVIKCSAPGGYQEILLADVRNCNFWQHKRGILIFKMRSGQSVKITGVQVYWPYLKKLVAQGVYARSL